MDNETLKGYMNSIGVMCETWKITFEHFIKMGMSVKEALVHTQGFMTAFLSSALGSNGGKQNG